MDATTKLTTLGNLALGCWLIAAPFVLGTPPVGRWNDVLVGTAVVLLVGYNDGEPAGRRPVSATGAGLVALLGCWLVVAPFVLGLEGPALWNDVVSGTVTAGFGSYDAYAAAAVRSPPFRATAEQATEWNDNR